MLAWKIISSLEQLKTILEIGSFVVTILGVPVAIYIFLQEKKKERKEREYGTYNALDDKYIEFLNICLANPELNIYYITSPITILTPEQEKKQLIIYEMLISILERAYLMYKDQNNLIKKEQWEGWNKYMHDWMCNESFRKSWKILGFQWEINFINYANEIYRNTQAAYDKQNLANNNTAASEEGTLKHQK